MLPGLRRRRCRRRSGSGSAPTTPARPTIRSTASARLADALGFDPAAVPGLASGAAARARAQRARLAGAAPGAGHRPVAERGRGPRRHARGRLRRPRLGRGAGPARRGAGDRAPAARGGGGRRARGAGHARPRRWRAGSRPSSTAGALIPDDSAGRPLALTPPGVLLRRLAALPGRAADARADLLVLAQASAGQQRARRAARAPAADRPARDPRGCAAARPGSTGTTSPPGRPSAGDAAPAWIAWLAGRAGAAERRRRAAARRARRAPPRRGRGAGRRAVRRRRRTRSGRRRPGARRARSSTRSPPRPTPPAPLDAAEYRALLAVADGGPRRARGRRSVTHPGIAIWGTLEARVQSADLVILGGLNEGIWPRLPGADPWLGRGMRRALGLPSPERRDRPLGARLPAGDGRAPRWCSTRATRDAEAPTVASRWLLRLENLLLGLGPEGEAALDAAKARGARLLADAPRLDLPAAPVPPARRPAPRPPRAARPAELSVTQVETAGARPLRRLRRARCCGLRRLDPPGREPDALTRGKRDPRRARRTSSPPPRPGCPTDAEAALPRHRPRRRSAGAAPWPAVNAIWTARLARAAALVPRRRGRAPRPRRPGGARGQGPARGRGPGPALRRHRPRRPHRPRCPAATRSTTTSPARARRAAEARAFHLQLPLEAAIAAAGGFEGLPPGPARTSSC